MSKVKSYRILVVDDSAHLLEGVHDALEEAGYQVFIASSGEEALALVKRVGLPHLAVVDINMPPGMDGFELCEELHEFSDLPIIMLTAVDEEETVIQALEQFAEDYITKPFDLGELLARVRRVIRRIGSFRGSLDPAVSVDEHMQVNFPKCEITMDGAAVALTPTETKLLYILMRSAGDILKASFIMRRLWPEEIPNEGKLRVNVHRLRDKIETGGSGHHYIVSHRGVGYQFMSAPTDVPI